MTNETKVKQAVSNWLKSFGCEIWWEQKNKDYDYPVFKAIRGGIGTTEKPDILILTNGKYYMCEAKNAEHKSNVYDALFQTLRYATNKTKYFIDGNLIEISGFMVATQHSVHGRLFAPEYDECITEFGEGRIYAIGRGELPQSEHIMTEQFTRVIWRGAKKFECSQKVGVLLSDVLNNNMIPHPLFLYKQGMQQGYDTWR